MIHMIPKEFNDIEQVIEMGAAKHGADSWRSKDNKSLEHRANHASLSRHLAEYYCGITEDEESGLHPLLHLACRSLMAYTRWKNEQDETEENREYNRSND